MSLGSSAIPTLSTSISPSNVANTQKVRDVKISPDTRQIVYQVVQFYKGPERTISELWIADTDVAESARKLTDGLFNDRAAVFHPDGTKVIFISDRHQPGKGRDLYQLHLSDVDGGNPERIDVGRSVGGFELSPDGRYVAFVGMRDGITKSDDDAKVFGVGRSLTCLWVHSFETSETHSVDGIDSQRHIESFTWSPDSTELLYRLRWSKETEYSEQEVVLERIGVTPGAVPVRLGTFPRSPSGSNIWIGSDHIASLQNYDPNNILDARTLFLHETSVPFQNSPTERNGTKKLYGQSEDAVRIVNMQTINYTKYPESGMLAVEVCSDVDTHIDAVYLHRNDPDNPEAKSHISTLPLFRTQGDAIWFGAWDAKHVYDRDTGKTSMVVAAVLSSGIRHEPPNVWSFRVDESMEIGDIGALGVDRARDKQWYDVPQSYYPSLTSVRRKLSSHLEWMARASPVDTEVIHWLAEDGTELSGIVRVSAERAGNRRLPTVLFIHGGPYRRDIPDFMPYFCNWRELFASAGYLVISPNYRGSQGRGHAFAHAANQGIGEDDWSDCESMVNEVIRRGLTDPERLAVAGWSHGGSLAAWGVTVTKSRFKAAVVGAGVSNWEGMVMESGSPELERAIGQRSPWDCKSADRQLSPIHRVEGVSTAVLILHGEKDERVPVGQAIGLYRGLQRKADVRGRAGAELVIYPREPHGFLERGHAENVMQRVLEHFDRWL